MSVIVGHSALKYVS
jgi:hypothetical protein